MKHCHPADCARTSFVNSGALDALAALGGLLLVLGVFVPPRASGGTITWTNVNGGVWSDATGWNPNQVPGAADDARLTASGTYIVTVDVAATVNSLTVGAAGGSQTVVNNGVTLTLNNPSIIQPNGILVQNGGTTTGSGMLSVNGTINWSGGLLSVPLTVLTNGNLFLSGSGDHDWPNYTLTNYGTVTWNGSCNVRGGEASGTQFYNFGLWDAQTDQEIDDAFNGQPPVFNNYGIFRKSGGTGTTTMQNNVLFNNAGLVDVRAGNLLINFGGSGGGTFSAGLGNAVTFNSYGYGFTSGSMLSGAGTFNLAGGQFTLPTTVSSTNVQMLGGSLVGSNVLNGQLAWYGGVWNNASIIIASNSVLVLAGPGDHDIASCVLTNLGVVSWSGVCNVRGGLAGTFIYNVGLWDAQTDQEIVNAYNGQPTVFNNYGTFRKSGGTGTTTMQSSVVFSNAGIVDVASGNLTLNNGGTGGGAFNAAAGDIVTFNQGYTFTAGSLLSGAGVFNLAGGAFSWPTTLSSPNVQMTGGSLTSPNVLNGQLAWYGGAWNNASIIIASNSLLVLAGTADHDIASCVLTNLGTVSWSGTCNVRGGAAGTFIYNFGLWDAQTDQEIDDAYGSQAPIFNNYGTFRKSGSSAGTTTMQSGVVFNNGGLVDVRSGNLTLNGGGTGGGTFNAAAGDTVTFNQGYTFTTGSLVSGAGVFNLAGGAFTLPATVSSPNVQMTGGSLTGPNVLNGQLAWYNGVWNNAGPLTIASNSLLVLAGTADHDMASCVLTNLGTVSWSGTCNVRGGLAGTSIYNFGLWDAQTDQEIDNAYGGQPVMFNNFGLLRKSAGTNTTTLQSGVTLNNAAQVQVSSGNLTLNNGGSGGGSFAAGAGDIVTFNQGYTFTTGSLVSGAGVFNLAGGAFNFPTTITSPNAQMTGGSLGGANTLRGKLAWYAGAWNGAGPITIAAGSQLTVSGSSDHDLPSCILSNFGTVTWSGICNLRGGGSGTQLYNYGLWDAQTDQEINNAYGGQPVGFNNYGTFRKSAGTANTTLQNNVQLFNYGTLDIQVSQIVLNGGATFYNSGTLNFGINSATNFGMLQVAGPVAFAGTVSVNFNNTTGPYLYPSVSGLSFGLISYASSSGLFSHTNLPPANSWWRVMYGPELFRVIATPTFTGQGTAVIPATSLWVDTNLRVTNGWRVLVTADGSWSWGANQTFGPDGDPNTNNAADLFYSGAQHAALIGYAGTDPYQGHWLDGSFFPQSTGYWNIGSSNLFTANRTGELWLGFNDDAVSGGTNDNSGFVAAEISIMPPALVIQLVQREGNTLMFAWATIPGRTYQAQYTTNFTVWNNLAAAFVATDISAMAFDYIGTDPHRFYRVVQLP